MKIFEKPGPENTEDTLKIALEAAYFQDIQTIVVASNSGETVEKLLAMGTDGIKIVCVTHVCGFRAPGEMEMPQDCLLYTSREDLSRYTLRLNRDLL